MGQDGQNRPSLRFEQQMAESNLEASLHIKPLKNQLASQKSYVISLSLAVPIGRLHDVLKKRRTVPKCGFPPPPPHNLKSHFQVLSLHSPACVKAVF